MRKTETEYRIEGNYGQGWEEVTAESTYREAREQLKCYRENEPYPHRIRAKRIPTEEWQEEARAVLRAAHVEPGQDFYTLRSEQVEVIVDAARKYKYRKPKDANGSTGRYFYALLQRRAK